MLKRLMKIVTDVVQGLWCHRVVYAGLAMAYGGLCAGMFDKELANYVMLGCYLALSAQRH
ncbi:MAG: hypothetical protein WBC85_10605 [Planktotalea sp.]|uniref:hypothetical protein n=1 Tax=Planktotalea sp. TaxID=2029877 RepID=UPI003C73D896